MYALHVTTGVPNPYRILELKDSLRKPFLNKFPNEPLASSLSFQPHVPPSTQAVL